MKVQLKAKRRLESQKLFWQLLPGVVILLIWELGSGVFLDDFFFSKPTLIVEWLADIGEWNGIHHARVTLEEILYGYVVGAVLGVVVGCYLGFDRRASKYTEPYILAFFAVPRIALAPLLIIWFGIGIYSKIFMAAVMVFFMVFYNTHLGTRSINQELINLARLMGARKSHLVWKVVLPFLSPYIMLGLRTGFPRAVIGAIVSEFVISRAGLGYYASRASQDFNSAGIFSAVIILLIATFSAGFLLGLLEKRLLRWKKVS